MNKKEDINDVISEIFKERPELLNNTTSLFELVMKIADERDLYIKRLNNAIDFVDSMEYCGQEDYFNDRIANDPDGNSSNFEGSKNELLKILKDREELYLVLQIKNVLFIILVKRKKVNMKIE